VDAKAWMGPPKEITGDKNRANRIVAVVNRGSNFLVITIPPYKFVRFSTRII
jgi:hypothetical protein